MDFVYQTAFETRLYKCPKCGQELGAFENGEGITHVQRRYESEELTREETIRRRSRELAMASEIEGMWIAIGNGVLNDVSTECATFFIGCETTLDIRASIQAALCGYYRQANMILRCWLEMSVVGVFFDDHPERFEQWQNDVRNSPSFRDQWLEHLFGGEPYVEFENRYNLSLEVSSLYSELSKFTHGRGWDRWGLSSISRIGLNHYDEDFFDSWFSNLKSTFEIVCTILFLRYPHLTKCFSELFVDPSKDMTPKFTSLVSLRRLRQWRAVGLDI